MKRALILVDLQNDFMPGGALAVPRGDEVIAVANALKPLFDIVVATQDWHPQNHGSFASNNPGKTPFEMGELDGSPQVMWPDHCVQGTKGADFHPDLDLQGVTIFRKGTEPNIDSYSGFHDNGHRKSTGLGEWLRAHDVTHVYIMGLATDYCVKATAIDAKVEGFTTFFIPEGSRGVNMKASDSSAAIAEMNITGIGMISVMEITGVIPPVVAEVLRSEEFAESIRRGMEDFAAGRGTLYTKESAKKAIDDARAEGQSVESPK